MSPKSPQNSIVAYINHLKGEDRSVGWEKLVRAVGDLFEGDSSLRGDLAHTMLYLGSRGRQDGKEVSAHRYTQAISKFADSYFHDKENGCFLVAEIDKQAVANFIHRRSNKVRNRGTYLLYILFMLWTAVDDGENVFFNHHIHAETGQISEFLRRLLDLFREKKPIADVAKYVAEFTAARQARSQLKYDLGGMIELGNFNSKGLWQVLFDEETPNNIAADPSRERYFVCYRYSSNETRPSINRMFLVFQSPGWLEGRETLRQHFAFKLFYRNSLKEVRRSAGSVLLLGSTITCFGSSEMIGSKGDIKKKAGGLRGPKAIVFNLETVDSPMLFGMTLSMNEKRVPIASRIIAIRTELTHSDLINIGNADPVSMSADLQTYTVLEKNPAIETVGPARWSDLIDILGRDGHHGTLESALVRAFDNRGLF
ncbi:hypothetical protein FJ936_09065 [Mesorhizobium sp. B2-4-13]|uniref:hypothetical protein n=1 Tax=Mesorhizobium sp. B2-4-13 TaxID=2589936 RepID=UPI001153B03C|nr:hypothetical protein [Mesorhizobium sp. B2-4-13]TPK85678.1 hypothetical protein FJ936_09065 [Mesorhizobium sp. B2-4-13]